MIPCKGRPKFDTILKPGRTLSAAFLDNWTSWVCNTFLPGVSHHTGVNLVGLDPSVLARPEPVVITSVSADRFEDPRVTSEINGLKLAKRSVPSILSGTPTAFAHRFNAAYKWVCTPDPKGSGWAGLEDNLLYNFLAVMPGGVGTTKSFWTLLEDTASFYRQARALVRAPLSIRHPGVKSVPNAHGYGSNVCGRLALLPEAAGKVRVVALMDIWTQWALLPLHKWLFDILREIPQDGTFDQLAPVKELLTRVPKDTVIHSYDLSAATDRIPLAIQVKLLGAMLGQDFAQAWGDLLVGRPYTIPMKVARENGLSSRFLRYAVGQPMGAYSSWSMLAFVHHAMIQFSAHRAGIKGWFALYAVLGDDVVIADDRVAAKYRALCRLLGVEIGLAKSLVSTGRTLEFAKRLFFNGEDISGLPAKFWVAAQGQSSVACALAAWVSRGGIGNFVRALGSGFRVASGAATTRWAVMPARARALCVSLTNPLIGNRFAFKTWPEWLWSKSADVSKGASLDELTALTPFCTSVHSVLIDPALTALEDYQEDLFFAEKIEDPVTRLVDSRANKAIVDAETSVTKASEALKHLQRLNIKMLLVQVSAIITQVWRSVDKAGLVPKPANQATVRAEIDPMALKVTSVYKHWFNLRGLVMSDLPDAPTIRPSEPAQPVRKDETEDSDDEENMDSFFE